LVWQYAPTAVHFLIKRVLCVCVARCICNMHCDPYRTVQAMQTIATPLLNPRNLDVCNAPHSCAIYLSMCVVRLRRCDLMINCVYV